jgi:hypothetical protein
MYIYGLTLGFMYIDAGLLARSQFALRMSCDRETWSRFVIVFLDPTTYAELVCKIPYCVACLTCPSPAVNTKISP